jgi:hypothetical protein
MPDDAARNLVAHQFAHGVQGAQGIRCEREYSDGQAVYVLKDGSFFGGNCDIELDADLMMDYWGLDSESVDRWALAAGI